MSVLVRDMLSFDEEIPLPSVRAAILAKVLDYCRHCFISGDPRVEIQKPLGSTILSQCGVSEWEDAYLDVGMDMLLELVAAANYLGIKSLLDLTCAKVASMIESYGIVVERSRGPSRWSLGRYQPLEVISNGLYSTVFKARDRLTGDTVALKRLKIRDHDVEGIPSSVIRETSLSQALSEAPAHRNLVQFKDLQILMTPDNLPPVHQMIFDFVPGGLRGQKPVHDLVLEYVPSSLHCVLRGHRGGRTQMPMAKVIGYSQDLLRGVFACHARSIMHRDLKPQHVLVHPVHGLQICDFSFACPSIGHRQYTPVVVTLWYRSPELLLGGRSGRYGPEVDVWSAGCILAEMLTSHPTFPGDSEIGTVFLIMQLLGSPTEATWPGFEHSLVDWSPRFPRWPPTDFAPIREQRPEVGEATMDLLRGLLDMNPTSRLTARRAQAHAVFSQPRPA